MMSKNFYRALNKAVQTPMFKSPTQNVCNDNTVLTISAKSRLPVLVNFMLQQALLTQSASTQLTQTYRCQFISQSSPVAKKNQTIAQPVVLLIQSLNLYSHPPLQETYRGVILTQLQLKKEDFSDLGGQGLMKAALVGDSCNIL